LMLLMREAAEMRPKLNKCKCSHILAQPPFHAMLYESERERFFRCT